MTVRPLAEHDLPSVAAMVAALNAEEGYDPSRGPDVAALRIGFLGRSATGQLLLAEEQGALLGYVTRHTTYETTVGARGCYLGDLYVVPAARRRGLGRMLVAAAAAAARAEGGGFLWWTALPRNAGGQSFYRALGAAEETLSAFTLETDAFDRLAREHGA